MYATVGDDSMRWNIASAVEHDAMAQLTWFDGGRPPRPFGDSDVSHTTGAAMRGDSNAI